MTIKAKLAPALKKMGMADEEVASLFNEDGTELTETADQILLKHDATRVQKLKDDATTKFNDGHKKGLSEGASKIEKEISEKFGIKSDKIGIELIEEIITSKTKPGTEGVLDEEKVKLHPLYVKATDDFTKQLKAKDKEWDEKFKTRDNEIAKQNLFKEVVNKAKSKVTPESFNLPKDKEKAERQLNGLLVAELSKLDYTPTEDGKDFILSIGGKPVEDSHGNRISFDDYVKSLAESTWDPIQGQSRQSAGNSNDGSSNGTKTWTGKVPSNEEEYIAAVGNAKDATERMAIQDAYKAVKN